MKKTYPHGNHLRYRLNGCRCAKCRRAHALEADRRRRLIAYGRWDGHVDATGSVRRLRALAAIGWSFGHVAEWLVPRLTDNTWLSSVARGDQLVVHAKTARALAAIYDKYCTEDGPSTRARNRARKKGWHGPEAWNDDTIDDPTATPNPGQPDTDYIDEVAVLRALRGERLRLTPAEQVAAAAAMHRRGDSATAIAHAVNCSGYTVAKLVGQAARHVQQEAA